MVKEFKVKHPLEPETMQRYTNALYNPDAETPNPINLVFPNNTKMTISLIKTDTGHNVLVEWTEETNKGLVNDSALFPSINFDSTMRLLRSKNEPIYTVDFT